MAKQPSREDPSKPTSNLAFRNLTRAQIMELASGQQLAQMMGITPLSADQILNGSGGAMSGEIARKVIGYFREQTTTTEEVDRLTAREREVFALVTTGLMNKQIAAQIGVSEITVKVHRGNVMRKMGARSLADLVRMAETLELPR